MNESLKITKYLDAEIIFLDCKATSIGKRKDTLSNNSLCFKTKLSHVPNSAQPMSCVYFNNNIICFNMEHVITAVASTVLATNVPSRIRNYSRYLITVPLDKMLAHLTVPSL